MANLNLKGLLFLIHTVDEVCEHQTCCNLIFADLLQVDEKIRINGCMHAVCNLQQVCKQLVSDLFNQTCDTSYT